MKEVVSAELIEKWLNGWSVSREVSLPVKYKSGFKVEVGWENQKTRYVFPALNEDLIHLAESIDEPWVFLKVCAACSELTEILPDRWTIQPQGYLMMSENNPYKFENRVLADGYSMETEISDEGIYLIKIKDKNKDLASSGRVACTDGWAIYDRIETSQFHQRKGLGSYLFAELQKIANKKGIENNILVATEEGRLLYESLGWKVVSLYTSVVIVP
ncbi:GNAT family N-acetyltransferase [Elizabethkingia sp. HvH-WGS333]|uniref:GNAT family N-acetyltransferase n=1 Tax=Elizabethkingia TaxID=308865 RepID=UPI0007415CE7|nr:MULTISPECIES: GNAT family N-acetyltransferase [Elizabethkingia]KUG11852.1 GNAT family acetyltransferase [Elizabethkingia miricola]MCL1656221.1 GNAT family N-acetyltransferase [Elizabethkingia miricola]OIK48089.1 GNAT family N-acetyltransferase [Elizabethkingia sp. HvH-WGS333]